MISSQTKLTTGALTAGAGILGVQAGVYMISALGVALTPLLTLHKGMDAGSVYLGQFLSLIIAALVAGVVAAGLMRVIGGTLKVQTLALTVLLAGAVALVFGVVAVTVKSHDDSYGRSSFSTYLESTKDTDDTSPTTRKDDTTDAPSYSTPYSRPQDDASSRERHGTSSEDVKACVQKYMDKTYTLDEYLACYKSAAGVSDSY